MKTLNFFIKICQNVIGNHKLDRVNYNNTIVFYKYSIGIYKYIIGKLQNSNNDL